MADVVPPFPVDAPFNSYAAMDWYQKVRRAINEATTIQWSQLTFVGSNLTDIVTRNHNDLQNIDGDTYHVTSAEAAALTAGDTVVIVTAKLTALGANGSMTFTNGVLTANTAAT